MVATSYFVIVSSKIPLPLIVYSLFDLNNIVNPSPLSYTFALSAPISDCKSFWVNFLSLFLLKACIEAIFIISFSSAISVSSFACVAFPNIELSPDNILIEISANISNTIIVTTNEINVIPSFSLLLCLIYFCI